MPYGATFPYLLHICLYTCSFCVNCLNCVENGREKSLPVSSLSCLSFLYWSVFIGILMVSFYEFSLLWATSVFSLAPFVGYLVWLERPLTCLEPCKLCTICVFRLGVLGFFASAALLLCPHPFLANVFWQAIANQSHLPPRASWWP